MEDGEAFTDPKLTLNKVSKALDIPEKYISQVINKELGKTFTDYLTELRVEKTKQDLIDPTKQNLTHLAIGQGAGFNSQSSFYNHFKKKEGMTPKKYKDNVLKTPKS